MLPRLAKRPGGHRSRAARVPPRRGERARPDDEYSSTSAAAPRSRSVLPAPETGGAISCPMMLDCVRVVRCSGQRRWRGGARFAGPTLVWHTCVMEVTSTAQCLDHLAPNQSSSSPRRSSSQMISSTRRLTMNGRHAVRAWPSHKAPTELASARQPNDACILDLTPGQIDGGACV